MHRCFKRGQLTNKFSAIFISVLCHSSFLSVGLAFIASSISEFGMMRTVTRPFALTEAVRLAPASRDISLDEIFFDYGGWGLGGFLARDKTQTSFCYSVMIG